MLSPGERVHLAVSSYYATFLDLLIYSAKFKDWDDHRCRISLRDGRIAGHLDCQFFHLILCDDMVDIATMTDL